MLYRIPKHILVALMPAAPWANVGAAVLNCAIAAIYWRYPITLALASFGAGLSLATAVYSRWLLQAHLQIRSHRSFDEMLDQLHGAMGDAILTTIHRDLGDDDAREPNRH